MLAAPSGTSERAWVIARMRSSTPAAIVTRAGAGARRGTLGTGGSAARRARTK